MKKHDLKLNRIARDDLHCHKCETCGTVWQHVTPPDYISADAVHLCPNPACGDTRGEYLRRDCTHDHQIGKIDYPWSGKWPERFRKENWEGTVDESETMEPDTHENVAGNLAGVVFNDE